MRGEIDDVWKYFAQKTHQQNDHSTSRKEFDEEGKGFYSYQHAGVEVIKEDTVRHVINCCVGWVVEREKFHLHSRDNI